MAKSQQIAYPIVFDDLVDAVQNIADSVTNNAKIPDTPTEDGTYTLKVTVDDGTATYAWVKDE